MNIKQYADQNWIHLVFWLIYIKTANRLKKINTEKKKQKKFFSFASLLEILFFPILLRLSCKFSKHLEK